mmetsp:Transcript_86908/g.130317  ORF Transcript_86908/g.130317 Transcript_86908/m.130317 type:complete len:258 (+) Transcript_86908:150-923(+)
MADFMEDEMIQEILRFSIDWEILEMENPTPKPLNSQNSQNSQFTKSQPLVTGITGAEKSVFSEKEKEILRNLPNKEFLMTKREQKIAMLNLLDILLAFTYDLRSTFGIHTVESGWTITRISSVLSSFESFQSVDEVICSFLRRSLSYPLYCNWELSVKIIEDVSHLFSKGKRFVLKAALAAKNMLQFSEFYAHFNNLYLNDYCVWIQSVPTKLISGLAAKLKEISFSKSSVGWDLNLLETTAQELADMSEDEEETAM